MPRITSCIDTLPTAQPTKSVAPTGGVSSPMPRFNSMIMPKWTGSTPKVLTTGNRIGVQISSSGARSIRHPSTSSMMLISIRITSRLCDSVRKNAVILAGSCISAIT